MSSTYLKVLYWFYFISVFVLGVCTIEPDFGRLDIRVGKILEVGCYGPDPELAFIRADFAGNTPKIIISDLYSYKGKIFLGHLRNKKTLFLMNMIKPPSYNISDPPLEYCDGMILLADDGENADILDVPSHAVAGDIVEVEGYKHQRGTKLSVEEYQKISLDLGIDSSNVAVYKDEPLTIRGEGSITTKTVYDCELLPEITYYVDAFVN